MLTERQQSFVQEYLIDLNGEAAYARAGYKARGASARTNAWRLLTNADIQAAIREAQQARIARVNVRADDVLRELMKVAYSDMRRFSTWGPDGVALKPSGDLDSDSAACVAEVSQTTSESGGSIKFRLHSKVQALELLGRHLALFKDKLEITERKNELESLTDDELAERIKKLRQRASSFGASESGGRDRPSASKA